MEKFGHTLLIANPVSQSGKGMSAATEAEGLLRAHLGDDLDVVLTEYAGHAIDIAANAQDYDTIIGLGGDGVVHEIANGLMKIPFENRPAFSVIPMGSGNDYARTLAIRTGVKEAVEDLLTAQVKRVDVGCCNGEHFVETLSFGLDAAIALDTVERRKHTDKTEAALYFESGIDQLLHHRDTYHFTMDIDGRAQLTGDAFMMAIQIGRTYGGGFIICPDALVDDGIFDICYADGGMGLLRSVYIFAKAKGGKHGKYKEIHFSKGSSIKLSFDRRPPCQMDGEAHIADSYDISILQQALTVLSNA
ncbi:MAG: diacylglycerol kinase family lipid kinase [Eggerthellaceae bacterium]|nr:diacylglycerol kinase family lipid kinase [Eggerthellaceae bacterium]